MTLTSAADEAHKIQKLLNDIISLNAMGTAKLSIESKYKSLDDLITSLNRFKTPLEQVNQAFNLSTINFVSNKNTSKIDDNFFDQYITKTDDEAKLYTVENRIDLSSVSIKYYDDLIVILTDKYNLLQSRLIEINNLISDSHNRIQTMNKFINQIYGYNDVTYTEINKLNQDIQSLYYSIKLTKIYITLLEKVQDDKTNHLYSNIIAQFNAEKTYRDILSKNSNIYSFTPFTEFTKERLSQDIEKINTFIITTNETIRSLDQRNQTLRQSYDDNHRTIANNVAIQDANNHTINALKMQKDQQIRLLTNPIRFEINNLEDERRSIYATFHIAQNIIDDTTLRRTASQKNRMDLYSRLKQIQELLPIKYQQLNNAERTLNTSSSPSSSQELNHIKEQIRQLEDANNQKNRDNDQLYALAKTYNDEIMANDTKIALEYAKNKQAENIRTYFNEIVHSMNYSSYNTYFDMFNEANSTDITTIMRFYQHKLKDKSILLSKEFTKFKRPLFSTDRPDSSINLETLIKTNKDMMDQLNKNNDVLSFDSNYLYVDKIHQIGGDNEKIINKNKEFNNKLNELLKIVYGIKERYNKLYNNIELFYIRSNDVLMYLLYEKTVMNEFNTNQYFDKIYCYLTYDQLIEYNNIIEQLGDVSRYQKINKNYKVFLIRIRNILEPIIKHLSTVNISDNYMNDIIVWVYGCKIDELILLEHFINVVLNK